jgi:dTDP-4-amino-4,6-dideoxygalactose transaminase
MNWHFAGNWNHMINLLPPFRTQAWPKSEALLTRAIAIPISVIMSPEQIQRIIGALRQAAKEVL